MASNEVCECCKGHQELSGRLRGETVNCVGKRHMLQLMSDTHGKGIIRGEAEDTNLRANAKENDLTHAKTFAFGEVDMRDSRRRKVTIRDVATLYGQLGRQCEGLSRKEDARICFEKAVRQWEFLSGSQDWANDEQVSKGLSWSKERLAKLEGS